MEAEITFSSRLFFFFNTLLLTAACFAFAWQLGFFRMPKIDKEPVAKRLKMSQVLSGFMILFLMEAIVAPMLYLVWMWLGGAEMASLFHQKLSIPEQGWLHLVAILLTAAAFALYCVMQGRQTRLTIWGSGFKVQDVMIGALTWLIAYPFVGLIGQFVALVLSLVYEGPHQDQTAVKYLKSMMDDPFLLSLTALEMVTLIPIIEELLFRGLLQAWLKGFIGVLKSIVVTSVIFAGFHFSPGQGVDNIELICSLFALSCFLGFLRERQHSLWASIGLHATFNAISIWLLYFYSI